MDFFKGLFDYFGNKYTYMVLGFVYGFLISVMTGLAMGTNEILAVSIGMMVGIMLAVFLVLINMMLSELISWQGSGEFLSIFGIFMFMMIFVLVIPVLLLGIKRESCGSIEYKQSGTKLMNLLRSMSMDEIKDKINEFED